MTRQVVLDTETTGLNAKLGDRIIEIGCVEILSRNVAERHFHTYLNPERDVDLGATRVHGLTLDDLRQKPKFAEVARQFLDFVAGAEVLIHNADFDVEFLDWELKRAKLGRFSDHVARVTDTLAFARELHPGKKNSLDALCERYFVNHANRTLHGALLDARLLAECYLAMTRGQESLVIELETPAETQAAVRAIDVANLIVLPALPEEVALHEQYLDAMEKERKAPSLWRKLLLQS
jgi:DNA polymerase-3 subunit epsilon